MPRLTDLSSPYPLFRRIYNFQQAYAILDEVIVAGEIQDSSKQRPLKMTKEADAWESHESLVRALKDTHLA